MKKKLSVLDITLVVLGLLSIVYGVLYHLEIGRELLGVEIGGLVNGILIIVVAVLLLLDKVVKKGNKNKQLVFALVFVLWVLVALFGFIIPSFEGSSSANASLWIGSLIIVYSAVIILFENPKQLLLLLLVLLAAFGGYMIGSNLLSQFVELTIVVMFVLFGLFALYKGLFIARKKSK